MVTSDVHPRAAAIRSARCQLLKLDPLASEANTAMAQMLDVTDESFEREVLQSEIPVLVDFWGDGCPACRQIAPVLDGLARERAGNVKFVKIHAAENARTSSQYGIRAMPTVLAFSNGAVCGQLVGARPKSDFIDLLDSTQ